MVVFFVKDPTEAARIARQIADARRRAGRNTIYAAPSSTWQSVFTEWQPLVFYGYERVTELGRVT